MAYSDYDADATELLETYGVSSVLSPSLFLGLTKLVDFLMKFIIIGA